MSDYVNRCILEADGVVFEDFESFTENSVTLAKQVNLMNKTGHASMLPRYGFSVNVKKIWRLLPSIYMPLKAALLQSSLKMASV